MKHKLVTLLTPCYNMERYIHRLLDSVLSQTYPRIEMIVIDDGSTDDSAKVVQKYKPVFEERGYILRTLYQPNSGQSVAIRNGLKYVNGEYLAWPDADDYYASSEAIDLMVNALEKAPEEFAMVRTVESEVDEIDQKKLWQIGANSKEYSDTSAFEDCLLERNGFYFCPIGYMIRFPALQETSNLQIYTEKDAGQNWQLFLPILYSYRLLTIKKTLSCVLHRKASHSRGLYRGYDGLKLRLACYERTIKGTLDRILLMTEEERAMYKNKVERHFLRQKMRVAFDYNQRKDVMYNYAQLKQIPSEALSIKDRVIYYLSVFHLNTVSNFFYCLLKK